MTDDEYCLQIGRELAKIAAELRRGPASGCIRQELQYAVGPTIHFIVTNDAEVADAMEAAAARCAALDDEPESVN